MIPKSRKFPLRTHFLVFRSRAKRLSTPHFTVFWLPQGSELPKSSEPNVARLAVIVPKKCARLATTRNWLKRLTYDTPWPLIKDKNLDLVVVYKPIKINKSSKIKENLIYELSNLEFSKV